MNAPLPESRASADDLARLAGQIARLEEIARGWDEHHAGVLSAIKSSIEALNAEAFRRLIRYLKDDPAASARLNAAVHDPFIFGVLRFHGLVKDPLEHRVERALEAVRPMLREHGGDVELVAVHLPDTVEVRMVGACHGCPASTQTLTEGVERSIRSLCPEVLHVRQVSHPPREVNPGGGVNVVHFVSPFAKTSDEGWERACALDEIPDRDILVRTLRGNELLFYRRGNEVSCVTNACAHLGMPIDGGELKDGVLTCPFHGFQYLLETGECLTVPEVQLTMHPVKVSGGEVAVRLGKHA